MLSLEEALASLEVGILPQPSAEDFACILHKCRKERNLGYARRLHTHIQKIGLEAHASLGNHLISMLVEVGSMHDAQQVFDRLAHRKESSWNSLITGYVKCGEPQNALIMYQKMQHDDSVHPNGYTFVHLLKACSKLKDLETGRNIHTEIARQRLLERDLFVGSTLVDMYAKCGSLAKAQEVFDNLPTRNVVSWNALITGYAKQGRGEEVLNCFQQMQLEGISPDAVTYACSLKACGSIGATDKGQEIHAEIAQKGLLEGDLVLGNALLDMYAKCGLFDKAKEVFDKLPVRDVISWNALIAGYANHEHGEEALICFEQMKYEGFSPNAATFVCSLKACGNVGVTEKGREIHAEIARKGLERDLLVGSTLVDMYAKGGLLAQAKEVFDKLQVRDVVSWTALIAGYVEHGHGEEALNCFKQMQNEGISPNTITLVCSLRACGNIGAIGKGQEIHAQLDKKDLLKQDLVVGNALVDMYAKCGFPTKAQEVFENLSVRDVVSWNALIKGYAECGYGKEALNCLEQMQYEGVSPDATTFACSLKACGSLGTVEKGREIHAEIARKGSLESDLVVGNALVDMYARCGSLANALEVFDMLPMQNTVSWNTLIAGYAENELGEEALNCFEMMQCEGVSPNVVTLICSLKACGSIGAVDKGQEIHGEIARMGLEKDLLVGSTLVDMYAKCGLLAKAREVFDKLRVRDVVSWTALIAGYAYHGHGEEALNLFEQMQHESVPPNAVTFLCSLKACGSIGAIDKGQEIHAKVVQNGLLERDPAVGNMLVDMYVKCGLPAKAQEVFDKLSVQDVVSWNSLIAGYAQLGQSENVFYIFDRMIGQGKIPDVVTFVNVLNACSHAGLIDKGQMYFEAMSKDYGIFPTLEHHTCMVDLLGRAGQLGKALAMIQKTLFRLDLVVWHTVLGACQKWGNVEVGKQAFEHAVQLGKKDAAAYVYMSNIYADAQMQVDMNQIESMIVKKTSMEEAGRTQFVDCFWWDGAYNF